MMKRRIACNLAILMSTVFLAACGTTESDVIQNRESETTEELVGGTEEMPASTEVESEEADEQELEGFRELTQEEKDEFTEFIQRMDAYGFLMSEYTDPTEVSLGEVFYSGAGLSEELSEEEVNAYLAACDQEEMYTDCVKVPRSDAENLVQERLGCSLDSLDAEQIGVYLPEFDAYYHECGDTNYMLFVCEGGLANGNVYTLEFKLESDLGFTYSFSHVQTILEKTENGYLFISNHSLVDEGSDL